MSASNSHRKVVGLVPLMAVIVFIAVIVALYVFVASHTSAAPQHVVPVAMAPGHTDWKGVIALVLRMLLQPTGL
jgi:flagellar basal body-associated protein FliL